MNISSKIIDYAIWYYLKYYPSPNKLKQKLKMKFGPDSEKGKKYGGINDEEIDFIIIEKLRNIIQEEEVIQSKIRVYKDKGKSKQYIKQKLFERQEDRFLIDKYLEEAFVEGELEIVRKEFEKVINRMKGLTSKQEFSYEQKSKLIEKLMTKGFKYDDIKIILNENNIL